MPPAKAEGRVNGHDHGDEVPPKPAAPAPSVSAVPAPAPVAKPAPVATAPVAPAPVAATPGIDPVALVRSIIADKTGYPEDMLDADMDLEGELGVDSIKQVEILSTLRERMPELPEIDPERLVELRTIAAIAAMVSGASAAPAVKSVPAPQAAAVPVPAPATAPKAPAGKNGKITTDIVRALIADKTGYPGDMLEDDMDLEGELGVDSIKQVEILSALRDQHPGLPEVDPEVLVELRTIRAIADFFA
jgi:acyl carrier protein